MDSNTADRCREASISEEDHALMHKRAAAITTAFGNERLKISACNEIWLINAIAGALLDVVREFNSLDDDFYRPSRDAEVAYYRDLSVQIDEAHTALKSEVALLRGKVETARNDFIKLSRHHVRIDEVQVKLMCDEALERLGPALTKESK